MFGKKKLSGSGLAQKIAENKVKPHELDLSNKEIMNSALEGIGRNPVWAKQLNPKIANEKTLILNWLRGVKAVNSAGQEITPLVKLAPTGKIAYLDEKKILTEEAHDNDIIRAHLNLIFQNKGDVKGVSIFQSFHKENVLKLDFETQKGEEIVYIDKELELPIHILAKLELQLKIVDPFAFVKFIDVNVEQITVGIFLSKLNPIISLNLRAAVSEIIGETGIHYYEISKYYAAIATKLKEKLQKLFVDNGIELGDLYVKSTEYTNNVNEIFEERKITFLQKEQEILLRHKTEVMSLENYEKKAAIHEKYPSFEIGLTEKEKDNAIDRYLIREYGYKEENIQQVEEKTVKERDNSVGEIKKLSIIGGNFLKDKWKILKRFAGVAVTAILALIGIASINNFIGYLFLAAAVVSGGICIAKALRRKEIEQSAKIDAQTIVHADGVADSATETEE